MWIDVGDLKQRQVPDTKGDVIPLSAGTGTYEIEDVNDPNVGWLFEGKLTVDKTFGHAAYGCALCCGDDHAWLVPDPLYTAVGSGSQDDVWGSNECFSGQHDHTTASYGWTSSNHAVATMGPANGWVNGIAAGTSTITGYFDSRLDDGTGRCTLQPVGGSGPGTVQKPDHLQVLTDTQQTIDCGSNPSTLQRSITYLTVDTTGRQLFVPFSLKENVPTNITSSCNGQVVQTGAVCTSNINYLPNQLGKFTDFLSPGCPTSSAVTPCGFAFDNQQWQWCPAGGSPTSIGTKVR